MRIIATLSLLAAVLCTGTAIAQTKPDAKPVKPQGTGTEPAPVYVLMNTNHGDIVLELDPVKAPKTVANFLAYTEKGYYDGTVFHRIIPTFMIQGGGFTAELERKDTDPPIVNESTNGLSNTRGTIAMARTNNPDSATSQFFINVVDNRNLDRNAQSAGYAVFGKVVAGMDVVDKIKSVPTGVKQARIKMPDGEMRMQPMRDVPLETVLIQRVVQVGPEDAQKHIKKKSSASNPG